MLTKIYFTNTIALNVQKRDVIGKHKILYLNLHFQDEAAPTGQSLQHHNPAAGYGTVPWSVSCLTTDIYCHTGKKQDQLNLKFKHLYWLPRRSAP